MNDEEVTSSSSPNSSSVDSSHTYGLSQHTHPHRCSAADSGADGRDDDAGKKEAPDVEEEAGERSGIGAGPRRWRKPKEEEEEEEEEVEVEEEEPGGGEKPSLRTPSSRERRGWEGVGMRLMGGWGRVGGRVMVGGFEGFLRVGARGREGRERGGELQRSSFEQPRQHDRGGEASTLVAPSAGVMLHAYVVAMVVA